MNCREAENVYLTDETLALLGTTWREASAKIVEHAGLFGNKNEKLAGAQEWDLQNEDLKNVISEVSSILDPKHEHWTIRVGAAIGRAIPTGQLRNFLGDELLASLWNTSR